MRANVAQDTPLGHMAKYLMSRGELVSDELVNDMVAARLSEPDTANGYILDGFPRTLGQAKWLDERLAAQVGGLPTGLVLDPYFSGTKIQWMLEHVEGLRERALSGAAVFGTIDSWLLFKLTGEHVTDVSNASRTLLYDIAAGRWDAELLELLDVPARSLPRVLASAGVLGHTRAEALHGHTVPVAGVAGDQQAALFGQACVDPEMGKNTYGTGSFVLLNTGFTMPEPPPGLISTVAWSLVSEFQHGSYRR